MGPVQSGPMPRVSVVICSIDPAKFARVTANYALRLHAIDHEIIAIHDARSLAEAYNRGVARSRGDVIVFSHDDVEHLKPDFAAELLASLERVDIVGAAGTTRCIDAYWAAAGHPHVHGACAFPDAGGKVRFAIYGVEAPLVTGIQALDGMFFAARREAFERVRFDEETFDGFHGYDVDFSYAAHKAGLRVGVNNRFLVLHHSAGRFAEAWLGYRARFLAKHFAGAERALPQRPVFIHAPFGSVRELTDAWDFDTLADLTRQLRKR